MWNTHLKVHFSRDHLVEIACLQHTLGCVQEDWETWPPPGGILLGCRFAPYTEIPNVNPFPLDKNLKTGKKGHSEIFRKVLSSYRPFGADLPVGITIKD